MKDKEKINVVVLLLIRSMQTKTMAWTWSVGNIVGVVTPFLAKVLTLLIILYYVVCEIIIY